MDIWTERGTDRGREKEKGRGTVSGIRAVGWTVPLVITAALELYTDTYVEHTDNSHKRIVYSLWIHALVWN